MRPSVCYCCRVGPGCLAVAAWSATYSSANIIVAVREVVLQQGDNHSQDSLLMVGRDTGEFHTAVNLLLLLVYTVTLATCPLILLAYVTQTRSVLLPWVTATLLSTAAEMVIDILILHRYAVFSPISGFIFCGEFFFLVLQGYTVYCVLLLYLQLGGAVQQGQPENCKHPLLGREQLAGEPGGQTKQGGGVAGRRTVRQSSLSRISEEISAV